MRDYFKELSYKLHCLNYKIGEIDFLTPEQFIDANYRDFKERNPLITERLFYVNLAKAMPDKNGEPRSNTHRIRTLENVFKICEAKLDEISIRESEKKEETFEPLQFDNISQKLLLLESLGVLTAISETTDSPISSRKMGRIIADLLGTKDLTRHLRYFHLQSQPKDKNNPRTENNLTALHRNLVKLKLPEIEKLVEKQLKEVMNKED